MVSRKSLLDEIENLPADLIDTAFHYIVFIKEAGVSAGNYEEDLAIAERLLIAERSRLNGIKGYSVEEFEHNMREAIKRGAVAHG